MTKRIGNTLLPAFVAGSLVALAAAAAPLPALASDADSGKDKAPSVELKDVQREWAEASKTLMAYTAAQRNQALSEGKKVLNAMDQRIDALETRAASEWGQLTEAARQQRRETLRALRKQRNEVAQWYGSMRQSSAGAWNEVRDGFVAAFDALGNAFSDAVREFDRTETAKKSANPSG